MFLTFAVEISVDDSGLPKSIRGNGVVLPYLLQTQMFSGYSLVIFHVAKNIS